MIYSTLKEVYKIDSFEKKKKKKKAEEPEPIEEEDEDEEDKNSKEKTQLYLKPKSTVCVSPETKTSYKTQSGPIKPFLDYELEQYLNVNEFKNALPEPKINQNNINTNNMNYVNNDSNNMNQVAQMNKMNQMNQVAQMNQMNTGNQKSQNIVKEMPNKKDVFYKNLINIGIFIFIGILIIFLCDQITELAVNIGMRKTVMILQPYLKKI